MPTSSNKQKVVKSFFSDYFGKFVLQGFSFITGLILTWYLEPAQFGVVAIASVLINYSEIFMNVGLTAGLKQRKYLAKDHLNSSFFVNITLSFLLFLISFFGANQIAVFFNEPNLTLVVRVLSFNFILKGSLLVHETIFYRKLRLFVLTRIRIVSAVVSNIIAIILAVLFQNLWCLVVQTLLSSLIYSFGVWYYSSLKVKFKLSMPHLRQLWSYGFYVFTGRIFSEFFRQIDVLIIGRISNANAIGLFQRGKSFNSFVFKFVGDSLNNVSFPFLSKYQFEDEKFFAFSFRAFNLVSFMSFLFCGVLFITAKDIVSFLFGPKWFQVAGVIEFLSFSMFTSPISSILISMLHAKGKGKEFFVLELVKGGIFTVANLIGIKYGLPGILWTNVIVLNLFLIIDFVVLKFRINITLGPFVITLIKHLCVFGITTFLSTLVLRNLNLENNLLRIIVLSSFYSITFIIFQIIFNRTVVIEAFNIIKSRFNNGK